MRPAPRCRRRRSTDGSGRRGSASPVPPPPDRATSAPAPALRCVERAAMLLPWRSSPQFCHDWRRRGSAKRERFGADEKNPGRAPGCGRAPCSARDKLRFIGVAMRRHVVGACAARRSACRVAPRRRSPRGAERSRARLVAVVQRQRVAPPGTPAPAVIAVAEAEGSDDSRRTVVIIARVVAGPGVVVDRPAVIVIRPGVAVRIRTVDRRHRAAAENQTRGQRYETRSHDRFHQYLLPFPASENKNGPVSRPAHFLRPLSGSRNVVVIVFLPLALLRTRE